MIRRYLQAVGGDDVEVLDFALCSAETEILDGVLVPIVSPGQQQMLFWKEMVSQML